MNVSDITPRPFLPLFLRDRYPGWLGVVGGSWGGRCRGAVGGYRGTCLPRLSLPLAGAWNGYFCFFFCPKTSKRPWGPHLSLVGSKWSIPRPSPGPRLSCRPVPLGTRVRQPPSREAFPHLSGLSGLEFSPNFLVANNCSSTDKCPSLQLHECECVNLMEQGMMQVPKTRKTRLQLM